MARIEVKHLFLESLSLKLVLDFYNVSENFHGTHYTFTSTGILCAANHPRDNSARTL